MGTLEQNRAIVNISNAYVFALTNKNVYCEGGLQVAQVGQQLQA